MEKPGGYRLENMVRNRKKTPQVHYDIVQCLLADGAVRQFASDTDTGIRRAYLTISAGDSLEGGDEDL